MLRTYIGSSPRETHLAQNRCHIDDGATAVLKHCIDLILHAIKHTGEINIDRQLPAIDGELGSWVLLPADAGVIAGIVQAPES